MRKALVSIAGLAVLLLVSSAAFADGNSIFRVDPRHAGIGAFSGWARDAGETGQKGDPQQYGLSTSCTSSPLRPTARSLAQTTS